MNLLEEYNSLSNDDKDVDKTVYFMNEDNMYDHYFVTSFVIRGYEFHKK